MPAFEPGARRPSKLPSSTPKGASRPAAGVAPPVTADAGAVSTGLGFDDVVLHQDDGARLEVLQKNGDQLPVLEAQSRVGALHAIHALRTLSPALLRVALVGGSDEEQTQKFVEVMGKARELAQAAASALSTTPEPWMINAFERSFLESGVAFSSTAGSKLATAVATLAVERAQSSVAGVPQEATFIPTLVEAVGAVSGALNRHPMERQHHEADLESCVGMLLEACSEGVQDLCAPIAPDDARQAVFSALLREGAAGFSHALAHQARQLDQERSKRTKAEHETWRRANPQGADLEPVLESMRSHMGRLVRLSKMAKTSAKAARR